MPRSFLLLLAFILVLPLRAAPVGADAGVGPALEELRAGVPQVDSAALVAAARDRQRDFERYRVDRIPLSTSPVAGGCDERIGRICHWFAGAAELDFPPEPIETGLARRELIGDLHAAFEEVRDPWVVGQLVRYLGEERSWREAEGVARRCDLEEGWWCAALLGYVLHLEGRFVEAEEAFGRALAEMPPGEAHRWRLPPYLLSPEGRRELAPEGSPERDRQVEALWLLSDPLFLVGGNDRWTDHLARMVEARMQADAENPWALPWDSDLEEALVRYGRTIGWSRRRIPPAGGPTLSFAENRSVAGHHHPASRGYLFPPDFLQAPAEVPPEVWVTAPREARTWYAPPYAPDFRALETQVARFRTDDGLLLVGAYRPEAPSRDPLTAVAPPRQDEPRDPFTPRATAPPPPPDPLAAPARGPVQAGLFLVPEDGGTPLAVRSEEEAGVLVLEAPPGRYVSSLELFEPGAGRAWRARQGVVQGTLTRGLVAVSDLLLLSEDAPLPATLGEAIPLARAGVRIAPGERFGVAWEVYGLQVDEEVQVTLGFTGGRPGFLQRVGEFLGILQPDTPVEVTFSDAGSDEVQTLFRAVQLTLPEMEPGAYTLHLRLELPGREPAVASRPILVEP